MGWVGVDLRGSALGGTRVFGTVGPLGAFGCGEVGAGGGLDGSVRVDGYFYRAAVAGGPACDLDSGGIGSDAVWWVFRGDDVGRGDLVLDLGLGWRSGRKETPGSFVGSQFTGSRDQGGHGVDCGRVCGFGPGVCPDASFDWGNGSAEVNPDGGGDGGSAQIDGVWFVME